MTSLRQVDRRTVRKLFNEGKDSRVKRAISS